MRGIQTVGRLILSAILIYLAVYGESKAAMAVLLTLMTLANEVAAYMVFHRKAHYCDYHSCRR